MKYSILTKNGTRDINEDSVGNSQSGSKNLFVLADGLGGHGGGEVASGIAVETAKQVLQNSTSDNLISDIIAQADENILAKQSENGFPSDMKTTIVCLTIENEIAQWGHVGDSRLYLFRKTKPITRTSDHSVPQALVLAGKLKEKKIRFHEDRSKLLRALGVREKELSCDISEPVNVFPGDVFLLCSDGFWEWINEKEMHKTLKKHDEPQAWLETMEKILLKNGGKNELDNYSAIAIFI